jgi:hypothetical protein
VKACKAEVEEAKDQLRQELEEEKKMRGHEKERNDELALVQASLGQIIKDLDDKAQSKYFSLCLQAFLSCGFILTPASFDLSAEIFPESQERAEAAIANVRVESTASDASPLDRRRLPAISFFLHRPYKDCRLASIKATGHRYQDLQVPLA